MIQKHLNVQILSKTDLSSSLEAVPTALTVGIAQLSQFPILKPGPNKGSGRKPNPANLLPAIHSDTCSARDRGRTLQCQSGAMQSHEHLINALLAATTHSCLFPHCIPCARITRRLSHFCMPFHKKPTLRVVVLHSVIYANLCPQ